MEAPSGWKLPPGPYDTFVETLCCVVRSRGATGAMQMELVHDALARFWDETVASGFPKISIQARLLSLASGLARNYVRRERRNPATQALPASSEQPPGSFPALDRAIDLKVVCGALLERLSPEHQAVISAVVYRELTVTRAADELGLHRSTAASRLTAALELLGTWMEESLSESERRA